MSRKWAFEKAFVKYDKYSDQKQIHKMKFDQIQAQIHRICICICICKYKYVSDPRPAHGLCKGGEFPTVLDTHSALHTAPSGYWYSFLRHQLIFLTLLLQNGYQTGARERLTAKTISENVDCSILIANKVCKGPTGYLSFKMNKSGQANRARMIY